MSVKINIVEEQVVLNMLEGNGWDDVEWSEGQIDLKVVRALGQLKEWSLEYLHERLKSDVYILKWEVSVGDKQEWLTIIREAESEKEKDELLEKGDHLIINKIKKLLD